MRRRGSAVMKVVAAGLLLLPFVAVIFAGAFWTTKVHEFPSIFTSVIGREFPQRNPGTRVASRNVHTDKFIDGLLYSGFNEASCLSRYQFAFYRKPSPYSPSPYLIERLRKYEELHKNCGPSTELYNRSITQLKSSRGNITTECKYVVWLHRSGLGNRILTLTSSFLYALLTGRILLVENEPDLSDLFCEPFPETTWLIPSDFPLFPLKKYNSHVSRSYGNMYKDNKVRDFVNGIASRRLPSYVYLHLAHDYGDFDKRVFCDEDQSFLKRIPWLLLLSDIYFVPSLFDIPAYEAELSKLFPEKDTVFHHLGRYLFHPTNKVWGLIARYYEGHMAKADNRVGIQIRTFTRRRNGPLQHVLGQIFACAFNEKLLPEVSHEHSIIRSNNGTRLKAVLVTSLQSGYSEAIRDVYWEHPAANGEIIVVDQPSHEEFQQMGAKVHEMKALAEMYLLSLSDVLVTSAKSTFGYVAQGLGGLRPWVLLTAENRKVPDPPCKRAVSMEPCFHTPPYYDCKANKVSNSMKLATHLTHCEDWNSGLKLVQPMGKNEPSSS